MRKKIFLTTLLLFSIFCGMTTKAQQAGSTEYVTIKKSDLPPDLLTQLEQQKKMEYVRQNIETANEIAKNARSIGHEIGVAFDEALSAVTKHASTFGKTEVGKFTMFMVAWAVMADEIPTLYKTVLGTLFGIPFIIFVNIVLFKLYRMVTTQQRRVKLVGEKGQKEYEYIDNWYTKTENGSRDDRSWFNFLFFVVALAANISIVAGVIL